ncbi:hypothetical protein M406DRAFT_330143 [Cryphonectria parasitica EP155]|uniref:Uncharacterized protein n=1 Tax=Cryphonectria parasitica (strain ATCC 38755 / EP155) TaxID=660469 RepID=A0A9P4Y3K3_CRYP1|nr:uncharacterized protein M406DRAFT_330143 [Cryphonectria parasitica EP155]KAF3766312.1 hypothetical protein M406DRAFT_330143 [Cryphonectria parasitica EP155]
MVLNSPEGKGEKEKKKRKPILKYLRDIVQSSYTRYERKKKENPKKNLWKASREIIIGPPCQHLAQEYDEHKGYRLRLKARQPGQPTRWATQDSRHGGARTATSACESQTGVLDNTRSSGGTRSNQKKWRRNPVLIVRSPSAAFLSVLLASPLNIDTAFLEAHAGLRRQPSSSLRGRRHSCHGAAATAVAATWTYPELVSGCRYWGPSHWQSSLLLAAKWKPVARIVSGQENLSAMFCRASARTGGEGGGVDVVLLSGGSREFLPHPDDIMRPPTRARRKGYVIPVAGRQRMEDEHDDGHEARGSEERQQDKRNVVGVVEDGEGEEFPDLVEELQEGLDATLSWESSAATVGDEMELIEVLEETAYERWLDFLEVLTLRLPPPFDDSWTSLQWLALQALEGNLDMANDLAQQRERRTALVGRTPGTATTIPRPDWTELIRRLQIRITLLTADAADAAEQARRRYPAQQVYPRPPPRPPLPPADNVDDDHQRSLDRVSYLGGVLLPVSIVSSVLSMNADFEPGQPLFWVFWAAAAPLVLLTVLIIYADKLRGAEVWEEVTPSDDDGREDEKGRNKRKKKEEKKKKKKKKKKKGKTEANEQNQYHHHHHQQQQQQPSSSPSASSMEESTLPPKTPLHSRPEVRSELVGNIVTGLEGNAVVVDEEVSSRPPAPASRPPLQSEDVTYNAGDVIINMDDHHYSALPPDKPRRPHMYRKKQLGWAGAAKCILTRQKPHRVKDGPPVEGRWRETRDESREGLLLKSKL